MEFTLSRCVLMICGIILIGAVADPVTDLFSSEEDNELDMLAQHDAELLDRSYDSGIGEFTLVGSILMPDDSYRIEMDGHWLTLIDNEGITHRAYMINDLGQKYIGYHDSITISHIQDNDPQKEDIQTGTVRDCPAHYIEC